jgi:hypothetical protein
MPNNSQGDRLAFLVAVLTGFMFAASICTGTAPIQDAAEAIWPTSGGRLDSMLEMQHSPDWVKFILDLRMSGAQISPCLLSQYR